MHWITKVLTGIIALISISCAQAQQFPARPIRVLVGFGPGGITDLIPRIAADEMSRQLGQPVIIENRTGANGLVAANAVKAAAPDGYTLYSGSVTAISPVLMKAGFLASREFTPISQLASGDYLIYVPVNLPVQNLKDLQAYAKANTLRLATPASNVTMTMALVAKHLGMRFEPILYKTTDQTIAAMLSGDTQVTLGTLGSLESALKANKLKAIATLSGGRIQAVPGVPTAKEQGVPVELYSNVSLWAPPKTPADVVSRLNSAVIQSLNTPAVAQKIRDLSFNPAGSSPAELIAHNEADMRLLAEAAEAAGYKPE